MEHCDLWCPISRFCVLYYFGDLMGLWGWVQIQSVLKTLVFCFKKQKLASWLSAAMKPKKNPKSIQTSGNEKMSVFCFVYLSLLDRHYGSVVDQKYWPNNILTYLAIIHYSISQPFYSEGPLK